MDGSLHGQVAMGPCRSTSVRDQHTISYQEIPNLSHKTMTHPIVVEPVLGKGHFPKALPDLVSGL
jgi:hypothetical protein